MILYRLIASLAAPFLALIGLWRVLRGHQRFGDLAERLGLGAGQPGAVWVHGASNGELTAARGLIESLRAGSPGLPLLITSNTVTARDMVRGWRLAGVTARLAPVDLRWVLAMFRARWRPVALISLENEIWPNRIVTSPVPVVVVAARMSANSAQTWGRFAAVARQILKRIDRLYPQDAASGVRFVELGLPEPRLGPAARLKSGVSQDPPDPGTLSRFQAVFPRADTILAASTHEGEEALVLQGFVAERKSRPGLRLILAPRHPRRSAEVKALIEATGMAHAVRSATPLPGKDCVIYLADTLGEMPLWYATAGITIVGGSFTDRGGHTPFEPAQFGSALIHGPDVANFTDSYAALHDHDAARRVDDAASLAAAIAELADPGHQQAMGDRAQAALAELDDSAAVIDLIVADLARRIRPG